MAEVLNFWGQGKEDRGVTAEMQAATAAAPAKRAGSSFSPRWIAANTAPLAGTLFGLVSLICLLALLVNVSLIQIVVLGYFFESSGRIARGGKLSSGFIGLKSAATLGRYVLCIAVLLFPLGVTGLFLGRRNSY